MGKYKLTNEQVAEIRARGRSPANPLAWGAQKVLAYDYGISATHLCQILQGVRRKEKRET